MFKIKKEQLKQEKILKQAFLKNRIIYYEIKYKFLLFF